MQQTVEAIYEEGVLKPTSPLIFAEHKKLKLIIQDEEDKPADILLLAENVYSGLSPNDVEELELLSLDRSRFSRE
ncbi:MAG: antitoxin family protein [Nitrospirae bacterium]|nr:antitoxin family protein [Nitrospirota bacterium]